MRILTLLILLAVAAPASAYGEGDAARVRLLEAGRGDVVAVWHEPAVVQAGSQWRGHIAFAPGSNVTAVRYQICHVGYSCFAPPTPAQRVNATTWSFDTNDYLAAGTNRPVAWQAGWRVGMKFILNQSTPQGLVESAFPEGKEKPDDLEYHYLAFDMPPPAKRTSILGVPAAVAILAVAALRRR